ncbi:MAG: DNA polymerase III subunit delta' [Alphaproteobacteria bacterium]
MSLFGDDDVIYDDGFDEADENGASVPALSAPQSMPFCLGHGGQERFFLDLFAKDALPHAMIFSGLEGIGKTTMAFRLARFLLRHGKVDDAQDALFGDTALPKDSFVSLSVGEDDPVFSRIASGGHADLLHIARAYDATKNKYDAMLKVEALRKIEPFLRKTSSEGGWRIVIVEDADRMNRNAQNAILKILEEPPSNVLIILIAHRIGALIPTILSRSRVVDFSSLSKEDIKDLLARQGQILPAQEMDTLYDLSGGSVGQALSYVEGGGLEMLSTILDHLNDMPSWKWARIHELSSTLSNTSQDKEYRLFAKLLPWVFRRILFFKARGEASLPSYLNNPSLTRFFNETPLERMIEIADNLKQHFDRVDFSNLDRRDAVRGGFLVISE